MKKTQKNLIFEIFCIILINLLLSSDLLFLIPGAITYIIGFFVTDTPSSSGAGMALLLLYLFFFLCIIFLPFKYAILPFYYDFLQKNSKSKGVVKFIEYLKKDKLFRLRILLLVFLLDIILCLRFDIKDHLFTYIFTGGLLGSYLVLFLCWDWQKKKVTPDLT